MSDVQKCDACGDVRFQHNSEYEITGRITDPDVSGDAIDIRSSGDLCDACALEVAQLIDDLGDDPENPDHRVDNPFGRRRPDGTPIVTEMDRWATAVATSLCRWVAGFRQRRAKPWENDANQLLVLAGRDYVEPLRERGVFEYGIARMGNDPNSGVKFPLETRFLFEEIPAGGNGEQMGWMSDAIERLEPVVSDAAESDQSTLADGGREGSRTGGDE